MVVTAEPTATVIDDIQDTAQDNITAFSIGALALGFVAVCIVLAFSVVQIGRSVPASLAGIYFNAAYTGGQLIKSSVDKLSEAADKSKETWDDEIVSIAKRLTNEQLQKLIDVAFERGVIIGGDEPRG